MRLVEGTADIEDVTDFLDELSAVSAATDATVQAFDARYVVDGDHLERAVERADRAFDRDENVARERSVEILLYAAGRRQIDRALEIGVSAGRAPVVVLVDGGDESAAAASVSDLLDSERTLGRYDEGAVRSFFDVTDAELAAVDGGLADVVHERVALLDVEK